MNRTNKKAQMGYGMEWLYKMVIIVVIAGGIVFVVLSHYSKQVDVRDLEASIISRKLAECIAPNGIFKEFSNSSVIECIPVDERNIYINITLGNDCLPIGDDFLLKLCQTMEQKMKVAKYPSCNYANYMIIKDGKAEKLGIFIAINKIESNL